MRFNLIRLVLGLWLGIACASCNTDGVYRMEDPAYVAIYVVHCDSILSIGDCYGPHTNRYAKEFSVSVLRNQVIPLDNSDLFPLRYAAFRDCTVAAPRSWDCTEHDGSTASLRGYHFTEMILDSASQRYVNDMEKHHLASVNKFSYYGFWKALLY